MSFKLQLIMKTVLPSIVLERHQTYLVYKVVGALYLTQTENQARALGFSLLQDPSCIIPDIDTHVSLRNYGQGRR